MNWKDVLETVKLSLKNKREKEAIIWTYSIKRLINLE